MLTADPVDQGAYWTMTAIRTDTLGPVQPPAVGDPLRVQAYLTDVPLMTLGNLGDVDAPPDTPTGKVLGTTSTGQWGPVDQSSGPSPATTNPVSVSGQSSSVGTSLQYARADHRHTIQFAAPVALGPAISAGTSTALARADHVHPVPALDALPDVEAPADTPAGKVLGTTGVGTWGPVDPPSGGGITQAEGDARYLQLAGGTVQTGQTTIYGHSLVLDINEDEGLMIGTIGPLPDAEFNGIIWTPPMIPGDDGSRVELASTLPIELAAPDGTSPNELVSKGYVDAKVAGDADWKYPTLLNGYSDAPYQASFGRVRYRKLGDGLVHVVGRVGGTSTDVKQVLFTFPAGYVPAFVMPGTCLATPSSLGVFEVRKNGDFAILQPANIDTTWLINMTFWVG
jgi:hypothetical protein